ncbi:hypothetical protein [Natronomonas sp.]|uniref:hypothetical protein n=1 Tax=Natronomonas sp. TaxID=2184060 RepID=UPI0026216B8C|nr:hypothetical protein [Natronomonas sp.]
MWTRSAASAIGTSRIWSLSAGLYAFACATAIALVLSDVLSLAAAALGLPRTLWAVAVAAPAFAIGAVVWWRAVERRGSYTYLGGGAFGLLTALLTAAAWTVQFVRVWGLKAAEVPMIRVLVGFVVGLTAVAGVVAGLPLMYVRRRARNAPDGRLGGEPSARR